MNPIEELRKKAIKCEYCDGHGYTSEHNDMAFDGENGEHDCTLGCPIQVQCHICYAEGKYFPYKETIEAIQSLQKEVEKYKKLSNKNGRLICKQRSEIKSLNGKYCDYFSLTLDGMKPEEAAKECGLL